MVTESGESAMSTPSGNEPTGTLSEEVTIGRLEGLRALRDTLAREIEQGSPEYSGRGPVPVSQTAALARQLRDVLKDIAEIEAMAPEVGSIVDELNERRDAARVAASSDAETAGGRR